MKILTLTALSSACFFTGCGGGGSAAPSPLPPTITPVAIITPSPAPTPNTTQFVVLGDSISCGAFQGGATVAAGGAWILDLPHSWPSVASALTGRPVLNLSVFGGGVVQAMGAIPSIPPNTTTIVYAGGTNDIAHDDFQTAQPLLATMDSLLAAVHAQAPNAKIVFLDVHRFAGILDDSNPSVYGNPPGSMLDSTIYDEVTAWNAHEKSLGPTVDIQDLPYYDASGVLQWPDGVHPTIAEAQIIGQMVVPVLR
jgi:lysophospholipase L1-like esterase